MKSLFRLLAAAAAVFLLATGAMADVTTGTIRVTVVTEDGTPIKGAQVTAESEDSITKRSARTNDQGDAILPGLDPSKNFVVTTIFTGFNGARNDNVLVRTGETTNLVVTIAPSTVSESVTVTAETPLVDVTTAISGQDITLELTESLPTGRSYQNYLQLVPGVLPDDPANPGNPASRSGLNYRDIGGDLGESRDNFYYLEGINVTDNVQGTFGANLNTEIIQEQKVITGGIPAEYAGAPGLISSVVTKFGGNEFNGSVNYFFQSDSLVDDNENQGDAEFSTFDTAFTLGGPIVKDKAWFFASYRKFNREDDVTSLDTNEFLRSVENDQDQSYAKVTYQATNNDRISGTFLGDPTDITGLTDRDVLNTRDESREQGGNRYVAKYQRVLGSAVLDFSVGKHNGELSRLSAINESANDVIFEANQLNTLADQQLGGFGENIIDERDTTFYKASAEWFVNSSWAQHTIKGGVEFEEHENFRDRNLINDAEFVSLNTDMLSFCVMNGCGSFNGSSIDARFLSEGTFTDSNFDVFNTSDFSGLLDTINALPTVERDAVYAMLDTNMDMTITADEAADNMFFDSTVGNPHGQINYNRDLQTASGPQLTSSEGLTVYLQDTLQFGKLTANVGLRAERWEHFATTGENIYTFDWEYAPRLSVVYDIKGDGRQKISGYYGRYYDPIRNNMTNFAGTLTGRITEEQVWVNDQWLSFRTRGGPVVQDAFFSPTTKTPYTDEIEIGYQRDLGNSMSIEANVIRRTTDDIMEDYDLGLYAECTDALGNPTTGVCADGYPGDTNDPDSLYLGLDYFGYDANPGSNFVIGTLAGGERTWDGVELIFRKRYSNNWQMLAAYTYADAEGNSNSDSNADFQGDVLYLDPRAPFQEGTQPGSIEQLFKAGGSYSFNNGIKVGGTFRWNSGTVASRTENRFRRNLPIRRDSMDPFTFASITGERWLEADAVGSRENPSWASLDLRVQYNRQFNKKLAGEFFLDIFNALDDQASIRTQDLVAGDGATNFGDPIRWVPPRRYFLGARVSF